MGNGDDSLISHTGWGVMPPPMNSGADWGSSSTGGSSSAATGSFSNSGNNHQMSSTNQVSGAAGTSQSATGGNCWQIGGGRSQPQLVSSSSSNNSSGNEQAAAATASSAPLLSSSSSWAQAAVKGLMSSTGSNSGAGSGASASNANNSNNVINVQSSPNSNALNGAAACSSSNISGSSSAINGPSSSGNIYSQDSYSAAINGSNNHNSSNNTNNNNLPGTTAGSAFGQSLSAAGNNNSSGSSSNENLSGGTAPGAIMNNKRAIATPNINDIIGNICDDLKETLLTDNWRSTVINQDSPWNLPPSPQSSPKDTSQWRCPVNSGTEIWESTVRQKKPCGGSNATVSGTAGTGVVSGAVAPGAGPSATPTGMTLPIGIGGNAAGMVSGGPSVGSSVGGGSSSQSSSWMQQTPTTPMGGHWGEPEEDPTKHWIPSAAINAAAVGGGGNAGGNNNPLSSTSSINNWQPNGNGGGGNSNNTWSTAADNDRSKPPAAAPAAGIGRKPWGAGYGSDATDSCQDSNWNAESNSIGTWNSEPGKGSAWERESNDGSKGPVDDGTALWGNPGRNSNVRVSGWKETPFGNKNNNRNGFDQGTWNKNVANFNGNANVGAARNNSSRSWMDTPQQRKSPSWDDAANRINGHGSGGLPPGNTGASWMSDAAPSSADLNKGWSRPGPAGTNPRGPQRGTGDLSINHLINIGCKKEDIENVLNRNQMRPEDAFRDINFFDDGSSRRSNACALANADRSHMSGMLGAQNAATAVPGAGPATGGAISNISPIASSSNRQMVQLIQFAVSAGILNAQILNQPMSQHNLEVVNDLLQQLKTLKNMQPTNVMSQVKIQQLKQSIGNLQNQIHGHYQPPPNSQFVMGSNKSNGRSTGNSAAAGPGAVPPPTPPSSIDFLKPAVGGGNGNNANANDIASSFEFNHHQQQHQQTSAGSKLGSWKLPPVGYNKLDDRAGVNEFARAPGPLQKQNSTPGTNQWGANFGNDAADWGDKELAGSLMNDAGAYTSDFDRSYGSYAWKPPAHGNGSAVGGSGAKPMDDDPRSRMQDPFGWNKSSPAIDQLFSNNNPWSYNPIPAVSQAAPPTNVFDLGGGSGKALNKKPSWGNQLNANAPDYNINSDSLWSSAAADTGASGNPAGGGGGGGFKTRPPPGLSGKMAASNPSNSNNASVWNNSGLSNTQSSSEYLRLSNLTPQIDGSTLKTLCLQHGPLDKFHLSLNHGIAIVRYATRDQALKAQSALNNCVLGNTTIYADLPSDNEIQQYSSILGNGGGAGSSTTLAQHSQQHQSTNNMNSLASNWSNGTNASHSHTAAGAGGNGGISGGNGGGAGGGSGSLQSYHPQPGQSAAAQTRANSVTSNLMNSVATNPASVSVLTTHSSSLPYVVSGAGAASGHNNHHQFNGAASSQAKLVDPTGAGGWSAAGASMWGDLTGTGGASGANLWSSAGATFSTATDRNTPTIQGFLPNDLLAGENN